MDAQKPLFGTLVIVGIGLLGGSIAAAVKARGLVQHCIGIDQSDEHLTVARNAGWIDDVGTLDAATLCKADLLILCTPVSTLPTLFTHALPH